MALVEKLSDAREQVLLAFEMTEKDVEGYVANLKIWLKTQPHLPSDLLGDDILERFLLKNKFSLEKTKTKIENYCTLKTKYLRFYEKYDEIAPSEEAAFPIPMLRITDDLHRIVVCRIFDEKKFNFSRGMRSVMLLLEIESRMDYSLGDKFLVDLAGHTPSLITKIDFLLLKDALNLAIKAYSARVTAVHVINCPKIFNVLMALLKTIVPKKIFSRIVIHQNLESLHEHLPRNCLPLDYGGELKSLKEMLDDYNVIFKECQEIFSKAIRTVSDEKSRSTPEATFRKLEID